MQGLYQPLLCHAQGTRLTQECPFLYEFILCLRRSLYETCPLRLSIPRDDFMSFKQYKCYGERKGFAIRYFRPMLHFQSLLLVYTSQPNTQLYYMYATRFDTIVSSSSVYKCVACM